MARGGYVLKDFGDDIQVIIMATGSEVQHAVAGAEKLAEDGVGVRVVSMPCREWFDAQDDEYRESVLPASVTARVSVEAGIAMSWRDLLGSAGRPVSIEHYGASAPGTELFERFGFNADAVVSAARESMEAASTSASSLPRNAHGPVGPAV